MKKTKESVEPSVLEVLRNYDYPGNIREMKNLIERLLVLSDRGEIKMDYLPSGLVPQDRPAQGLFKTDYTESLKEYRSRAEREYIRELITRHDGDMNQVAEVLSITRRQLFNKMVEYGLK